ncbi:NAD-dependent epimerase/dehydratase family protein [Rothia nasimurium]|uniref:NAD-dependent epimerase/dehydratase family protein n=1 Tax=Rothia nasimurium TaxID=85336 RepID=UPI001F42B038|nr:NAD-dependent epimerase/dehydratase family protein [Rothia nasimurium]
MAQATWKVIGASGFVGSSVVARLTAEGVQVDAVEAPRLLTRTAKADQLIREARQLDGIIDTLAESFAGCEVVINTSGLAAPDQEDLAPLLGANALLPAVIAIAAQRTGVSRVIHLSSAAVLGSVPTLTPGEETQPFSAYSFSKALGEEALLTLRSFIEETAAQGQAPGSEASEFPAAPSHSPASVAGDHAVEICIIRATSVQGRGRRTTEAFTKIASSPLASVAGRTPRRTPVSSNYALAEFVYRVASFTGPLPAIVMQPWEGATTESVLIDAGRRRPLRLPVPLCRALVATGYKISDLLGDRFNGPIRRVEVMWFGQDIDDSWARDNGLVPQARISEVLRSMQQNNT